MIYGMLTFLEEIPKVKGSDISWKMKCNCGNEKVFYKHNVTSGASKSCGCLHSRLSSERKYKHGESLKKTKLYWIWLAMRDRCNNPNNKQYADYGGRGIKVCDRWNEYENFRLDMREKIPNMSIDRKNNSLGYSPDNCKWSTIIEQNNNRRPRKKKRNNS